MFVRLFITISFTVFFHFSFSQKKINYFPQEQLVHPNCQTATDPALCLYSEYKTQLENILLTAKKEGLPIKEDTLKISLTFSLTKRGLIDEDLSGIFLNDSILSKHISTKLNQLIRPAPKFGVINKKPKKYEVRHHLRFSFVHSDKIQFIPPEKPYYGGEILEIPKFPGCNERIGKKAKLCFNNKIKEHIRKHFRYPEEAQELGLQVKFMSCSLLLKKAVLLALR